ncbi:hypothetical protein [Microbulbifer sp. YPW16]|uniref:hypothetical protein n=1 Tax=Microbulbifer sp. YPW16 TaxID=2904242 RepID=UPI001E4D7D5F|nr:hypothetical protein [Microbulbifer sp. YPW16]UHQ56499.1 hypothetical protein LVE68_05860 [Microbulbifer sp. YPW16]
MKVTLGLVLSVFILLCIGIAYWFGAFSTSFNTNMCYSEVIRKITAEVKAVQKSDEKSDLIELSNDLEKLPLHGYESSCEEIKRAVENL